MHVDIMLIACSPNDESQFSNAGWKYNPSIDVHIRVNTAGINNITQRSLQTRLLEIACIHGTCICDLICKNPT